MSVAARRDGERGQVFVFVAVLLTGLIGMAALVIDVGSWFHGQRHLQTAADAAALAGAQELPDQTMATSAALDYAQRNFGGIPAPTITFPASDTIDVAATATAPGILSKIYGSFFNSITLGAHAQAKIGPPEYLKNVAPIVVKDTVACTTGSCFGQTKRLNFSESNLSSSSFGLIDLSCYSQTSAACSQSAPGASTLAGWITCTPCYSGYLPTGVSYDAVTGQKIGPITQALTSAGDNRTPLFFPVFDTADNVSKTFHVVGWAAFVLDPSPNGVLEWKQQNPSCDPDCKVIQGHFVTYLATALASGGTIPGGTDYGVRVVTLTQ